MENHPTQSGPAHVDMSHMSSTQPTNKPVFFASAGDFRVWLANNSETATELNVGFHRVGSGRPSLTWPESVDEALCVGWIDSVRKRIDDHAYQIRFTPRREGSIWSSINIAKAKALIAAGRMKPAGLRAYQRRTERKSGVYSYEQEVSLSLTPDELKKFKKHRAAWAYFEKAAPSYRRIMVYWVVRAKQRATRARRLAKFIEGCAAGVRFLP
jgi:uncharacterized protein YdeI (YjbR/CyaY-like superfamily)